jgi:hypothetical protein
LPDVSGGRGGGGGPTCLGRTTWFRVRWGLSLGYFVPLIFLSMIYEVIGSECLDARRCWL